MEIKEYKTLNYLVDMVLKKEFPSCLIISEGGLGKSYHVRTMLKNQLKKDDYVIHSGHITPLALYIMLYKNKNKIIVLDDMEELLKSDIAVSILRAALWDVEGDGKRTISWGTTSEKLCDIPQEFEFNGGMILLANKIPRKHSEIVRAFRTRGLEYTIYLTYKQKLNICQRFIDDKDFFKITSVKLTDDEREQLKKDLAENTSPLLEDFNYRSVVKLLKFYKYHKKYYPEEKDLHIQLLQETSTIDENKRIVWELMHNDELVSTQKVQIFNNHTGKSPRTYYRIKKSLEKEMVEPKKISKPKYKKPRTTKLPKRKYTRPTGVVEAKNFQKSVLTKMIDSASAKASDEDGAYTDAWEVVDYNQTLAENTSAVRETLYSLYGLYNEEMSGIAPRMNLHQLRYGSIDKAFESARIYKGYKPDFIDEELEKQQKIVTKFDEFLKQQDIRLYEKKFGKLRKTKTTYKVNQK